MEIDEKNLKQHFETIMNTKELSDLTLKQARVIATLMEHERLKVLEVDGKEEIKNQVVIKCSKCFGLF